MTHDYALAATPLSPVPVAIRYTRGPSVFSDTSLSPSFLRTTAARKPRTECGCQPVDCMMPAIVAPLGRLNRPRTRICFECARVLVRLAALRQGALDRTLAPERALEARAILRLGMTKTPSHMSAHYRAATAKTPRRPSGAGGERASQSGLVRDHHACSV